MVDLLEQEPDFCLDVDQLEELLGDQVNLLGSPRGSLKGTDLKAKLGDNIEVNRTEAVCFEKKQSNYICQVRGNLVTLPLARLCAPLESRLVNLLHETPSQVATFFLTLQTVYFLLSELSIGDCYGED